MEIQDFAAGDGVDRGETTEDETVAGEEEGFVFQNDAGVGVSPGRDLFLVGEEANFRFGLHCSRVEVEGGAVLDGLRSRKDFEGDVDGLDRAIGVFRG